MHATFVSHKKIKSNMYVQQVVKNVNIITFLPGSEGLMQVRRCLTFCLPSRRGKYRESIACCDTYEGRYYSGVAVGWQAAFGGHVGLGQGLRNMEIKPRSHSAPGLWSTVVAGVMAGVMVC